MIKINVQQKQRDIVVIGASAGGLHAVRKLIAVIPGDIPATLALVVHRHAAGELDWAETLFSGFGSIPMSEALHGETLKHSHLYIAPPAQHLLLKGNSLRLTCGPKEHYTRPAIDPLFRSAAESFGERVVGIVLTGSGTDGARGLRAIRSAGGIALVQEPSEASHPEMPHAGLALCPVDGVLVLREIAACLWSLANGLVFESEQIHQIGAPPG